MSKESDQGSHCGSGAGVHPGSHQQLSLLGAGAYRDTGVGSDDQYCTLTQPSTPDTHPCLVIPSSWVVAGLGFKAAKMHRKNEKGSPPLFTSALFPQLHMVWNIPLSVGASSPGCVSSQLLVHPQPPPWWGGVRGRTGLDSA